MWKYNYVHRDVSIGNIMWDPSTNTARLSDLEFMKRTPSDDKILGHESRTVCYESIFIISTLAAEFMATEVYLHKYVFTGRGDTGDDTRDAVKFFEEAEAQAQRQLLHTEKDSNPALFRHNSLHDLESIWWIALWTFLHLLPVGTSRENIATRQKDVHPFFPGRVITAQRNQVIQHRKHPDLLATTASIDPRLRVAWNVVLGLAACLQ